MKKDTLQRMAYLRQKNAHKMIKKKICVKQMSDKNKNNNISVNNNNCRRPAESTKWD